MTPRRPAGPIQIAGERPVVIAGTGARQAVTSLRRLVAGRRIPVLATYRAKGVVPDTWPNVAGVFSGFPREGRVLERADAIVTVGLDPVELHALPWPWPAPVTALTGGVAVDRAALPPATEIDGTLRDALDDLRLADAGWDADGAAHREAMRRALDVRVAGLAPQDVVRAARSAVPAEAVATVDAGAHMLVALPFWEADDPRRFLISSGLATMGFALPAAIGASHAVDAPVVCLCGDGGLGMALAELETVARRRRDVRVVVLNDGALSLIRAKQSGHRSDAGAVTHGDLDFAAVARAAGIAATVATTPDAVAAAVARPGPVVVDARIDPSGYGRVIDAIRGAA